jgi:hypothetical protein
MKKSLYITSALVAVSVLAAGATDVMAAAHAKKAKKMSMAISGSYKAVVGYAKQGAGFSQSTGVGTAYTGYQTIDVKTDSELHFKGKTTTNSGIAVGVAIEIEGDQQSGGVNDASYVTLGGNFGTFALGSTAAASAIMAVNAPSTGALGIFGGDSANWIIKPAKVAVSAVVGANIGGNDRQKIRWVSPSFSGFTAGGSYVPDLTGNDDQMGANGGNGGTDASQIDFALKYSGKLGANSISASAAYWAVDQVTTAANAASAYEGYSMGASTTMGAWTVGAGYKEIATTGDIVGRTTGSKEISGSATSKDEEVHNIGIMWAQGPTTLSLNYFNVDMDMATATEGEDSVTKWTLGGKYNVGPGVDFVGSIQNVNWGDEDSNIAINNNKGTAFVGGVNVAF